jgi:hypothetical protein
LTTAWLFLVAGGTSADIAYLNQLAIKIPLDISAAERQHIQTLTLYYSTDEGRTWHQQAMIGPDQDSFKFFAPRDGLYWFTVDVQDHEGRHNPPDIYKAQPSQKIIIDTHKPELRIVAAERKDDDITVAWEIQEDHPDLTTLRMDYRAADTPEGSWYPAPLEAKLIGQTHFRVNISGAVSVRMRFQDLAKNQATAEKEVPAGSGVTTASLNSGGLNNSAVFAPKGSNAPAAFAVGNPPPSSPENSSNETSPLTVAPRESLIAPPLPPSQPSGSGSSCEPGGHVLASSEKAAATSCSAANAAEPQTRRGSLPPVQIVKSPKVTVEYTLKDVGPSGIGRVEVWLTSDDGLTWRRYAEDLEVKQLGAKGRAQRQLELPGEGIFGISLVVRSRAGRGKPEPKSGDAPQMRIEVDTTPPVAELFDPLPQPHCRDALTLSWKARDPNHANLADKPITLQWSESKGGAWQNIAAHLPNTGQYLWHLPPNLPERVYLRLVVRDTAGNEGIAETAEPQLVDLSEPEGQFVGVVNPNGQ